MKDVTLKNQKSGGQDTSLSKMDYSTNPLQLVKKNGLPPDLCVAVVIKHENRHK